MHWFSFLRASWKLDSKNNNIIVFLSFEIFHANIYFFFIFSLLPYNHNFFKNLNVVIKMKKKIIQHVIANKYLS
jgi:hypothetical protein